MTKIEFCILCGCGRQERLNYVEQLTTSLLARGKSVHIHTSCARDTRQLMVAFQQLPEADNITIDHKGEPENDAQVLFNLSAEVPFFFSRFETTFELIHDEADARALGRERYRYYQERGYPLTHKEIQPQLDFA